MGIFTTGEWKPHPPRTRIQTDCCGSIWAAIKREALLVAAEGVATPTEIDAIYKDVLKTPVGPFEQMDVVGLDVALAIEEHYAERRCVHLLYLISSYEYNYVGFT